MLSRFPHDLPLTGALAGGLPFAAKGFAGAWAELAWGRPSSTAALGYAFVPVVSAAVGVGFFLMGWLARSLLSEIGERKGTGIAVLSASVIVAAVVLRDERSTCGTHVGSRGWLARAPDLQTS